MTLLSVAKVSIHFGGVQALDNVSFDLNRGEILGLIGPNGAGKTTLFNCISGVLAPSEGRIDYEGSSLLEVPPHERAKLGIARTFQNLQLWRTMTVLENCQTPIDALGGRRIISDALRLPGSARAEKASVERARAVLFALDLLEQQHDLAGDLPVGIQRRVELARALCMRPSLLLLDEPASGLDAGETEALAESLRRIRERFKVSILLVDHDMSLVMRACHYIYVLDFGEIIAHGRPDQVREDPKVIAAYLGEESGPREDEPARPARVTSRAAAAAAALVAEPNRDPILSVSGLNAGYGGIGVVRGINLEVGKGEIVACIGANGAGKTTTLRAISGVVRPTGGTVHLDGVDITRMSSDRIVRQGMLHVPQGRGLFPSLSVDETFRLAAYSGHHGGDYAKAFEAFPILRERRNQLVGTLSGGQQQMVALARALLVKPKLLLIDEMSQGLAPLVVRQLFEQIEVFKAEGIAVLLVEQFVESALSVANRVYIFEQGTIAREAPAAVLRQDQSVLASAYLGTAAELKVAAGNGAHALPPQLLDDLQLKLPAEIKRALEERAAREGKETDALALELLEGKR